MVSKTDPTLARFTHARGLLWSWISRIWARTLQGRVWKCVTDICLPIQAFHCRCNNIGPGQTTYLTTLSKKERTPYYSPSREIKFTQERIANVSPLVQRHLGRIYRCGTAGLWTWSIPSRPTRSMLLTFFSFCLIGGGNRSTRRNPRCQVGPY